MNYLVSVKICGIRTRRDAAAAVACGVQTLGFVFAPSPRRVTPEQARDIIRDLPSEVLKVGVFVDAEREEVEEIAAYCGLDALQFHGHETPAYCRGWSDRLVIKSFRVQDKQFLPDCPEDYCVDAILLDSYVAGTAGGTGKPFNWELGRRVSRRNKFLILAGGLHAGNVARAVKMVCPDMVDVSSGVETNYRKSQAKIAALMEALQQARS